MADYIYIKNYSKLGEIAISRQVFKAIVEEATNKVIGAQINQVKSKNKIIVKLFSPVKVTFHHNGQVEIDISIALKKGANANEICLKIQENVAQALLAYTESVSFDIQIKVASII